jgi:hypothetical protein
MFFLLMAAMLAPIFMHGSPISYSIDGMTVSDPVERVFFDYPELTELTFDDYDLEGWLPDTENYVRLAKRPGLRLETRHKYIPGRDYLTNRFLLIPERKNAGFVPNAYVVYYQKLRKAYYPENLGQAGLFFNTKGLVSQVVLGNFSLKAGEGLSLGCSNARGWGQDLINPAFTLSHPVLSGAAVQLKYHDLESVVWLSQTERLATMEGDKIVRLYESLISDLKDKDKIQEKTNGIIVKYSHGTYYMGAHYYQQDYSKLFADSTFNPVSDVLGLWGSIKQKRYTFSAEASLIDDKAALGGSFSSHTWSLSHTLRYIYRPETGPLSFSRTKQIFGQRTAAQEISWDSQYAPTEHLILMSRIAAYNELNQDIETKWKERLILSADRRDNTYMAGLTWYRFQRDAVSAFDSLGSEILPTQNRLKAHWYQDLSRFLKVGSVIQYQHYLDQNFSKNGFSLQQSVDYKFVKAHVKLSFLGWVNQKSSYQPSEDQADEELLIQAGSDSALRLQLDYRFNNAIDLGLGTYFPFKNTASRSFQLNLKTAF